MKHLFPYFRKYRADSLLSPLFKVLEACFDLAVPLIVADMIDRGIAAGDTRYIVVRFLLLLAMALFGFGCTVAAQFFAARASAGICALMRHDMIEKIGSLSRAEIDRAGASTLITRMTSDVNQVQNGLNMFLRLFIRSPFIVFGSMILAFTIDASLALLFVGAIVLLFFIVFGVMKLSAPGYRRVQQNLDGVTEATRETLTGVRVIRAFSREEKQNEDFQKTDRRLLDAQLRVGRIAAVMNPLTYVTVNAVIVLVLWFGAAGTDAGLLLSGSIIALINYISQILVELVKLANLITLLGRSATGMRRIGQVLDTESSLTYGEESPDPDAEIAVRFCDVSFRYGGGGADAVSHLSFTVRRGQTVGIIGGTGSGKSTLVNLILRYYDATDGEIELLGKKIGTLSREALRKSVTVVSQRPRLFRGTVRSNLLLADPTADDDALWRALSLAQAEEFVRDKNGGLDAPVEQDGANFSGGQRQRLTIARALLAGAKILILDDSFSALDYATDAALRRGLSTLPEETTVFLISQRAGSLTAADLILVLEDGAIVGAGRHGELLENCAVYREIYESQTNGDDPTGNEIEPSEENRAGDEKAPDEENRADDEKGPGGESQVDGEAEA